MEKPFWMGEAEVTLEQYRQFDPEYLNGWYDMHYKDQSGPVRHGCQSAVSGYPCAVDEGHGILPLAFRKNR